MSIRSMVQKFTPLAIAAVFSLTPAAMAEPVLLCGGEEVFLIDTATAEKGKIEKLWSWRGKDRSEIPEEAKASFRTTDDCKPVDGGAKILISCSSGGCALVERASGRVLWHAVVPSAHSLDLLPHDRVLVAASVNHKGPGNRLVLFDLAKSDQPIWETPLDAAHGVVWDAKRQSVWALGYTDFRCYKLKDWDGDAPSLSLETNYVLEDNNGHDLMPVPQGDDLVITTGRHVFLFDRTGRKFRPHPQLGDKGSMKCVSVHPATGRTIFLQGDGPNWWNHVLGLLTPTGEVQLPEERLYKARWLVEAERK